MDFLFVTRRMAVMNNIPDGGCVRSTLLIEALSKLGHVDVISFVKEPVVSTIPNCDVIYSGATPESVLSLRERILLNMRLFFAPWKPDAYYVVNKEQERIVSLYYNAKHYDYVVCHFIWDAVPCGLMKYADRLIIDVDDNLVSGFRRDLANNHHQRLLTRIKDWWMALMSGMMQEHLLKRVRLSFFSNLNDSPFEKSVFLQNVSLFSHPCSSISESTPMRLLFVGKCDFFPNKKGILHFVDSIFPIIKDRIPSVELNIVGKMDNDFKSYLSSINGVNALGFVDCLQDEYQNCRAVIVPLYHGAGTSIKFIEGIMMNRPIVSTQVGARGFNSVFQANRHYLLANSDQEFAECVVNVLSDIDKANMMAREALEIGAVHFSKDSFFDVVKESIEAVADHQASRTLRENSLYIG